LKGVAKWYPTATGHNVRPKANSANRDMGVGIGGVMMTSLEVSRIHQMSDLANELRQQLAELG
jgi:hypothetical protein